MKQNTDEKKDRKYVVLLMAAIMAAAIFVCFVLGIGIWEEYKKTIIDNQKEQMLLTVRGLSDSLEVFIEEYEADLENLLALEEKAYQETGQRNWEMINEYVSSHSQFVYDVIVEDRDGRMIKNTKGYDVKETYSVSEIQDGLTFRQCRLENGEMYLVLQKEREDAGSIAIAVDLKSYYQSLISGLRLGTNGYVVAKDSRGIILMHPQEEQWGIDVISGRKKMYPDKDLASLEIMIERQNRGEEGISEYYSYWWLKPEAPRVKKISAYAPAKIGKDFLVVSAVIDYNDIYIPIAEGFFKLALVFSGIITVILVMAFFLIKLLLQKKKDTEEIAYLTELNRILEELHQSEEAIAHQQRLQIMGTMTGGIAHEFNNLLTPIMGYADLMRLDLPEDSELYDSATEIYEASVKAKEIIQQISSLSRKNMETAYKNLNAGKVMRRALKMVHSVCPPNVHLKDELSLKNVCFLGNETQMNQVILNICVNAIHAIGRKEGLITVRGTTVERSRLEQYHLFAIADTWDHYIKIDIEDNGCGMSEEVRKQIFDPFFTTKKGGKGTGLGLALVEQIIASHKGYIFVDSEPEKGSTFHLYLPVNEQKEEGQERGELGKLTENEAGETKGTSIYAEDFRLLMIDDNPKVLKLLEKNFGRLHIPVVSCMDFEEARKGLKEQHFDAMAAEQYISGKSAVDFFMSIQGQYPGLIRIVMADQITRELVEAKQRRIIDEYIEKPVSDSGILKAVKAGRKEV